MTAVKCVVWDLDGTVWDEVAVELPDGVLPRPRPDVLAAMRRLSDAGVLNSVASRSDPAVADLLRRLPDLDAQLVAPQVGWQDKSRSLHLVATDLGISVDALLLVDDSAFERAEVAFALPQVPTLDRTELLDHLDDLLPEHVSAEGAGRTLHYQAEQRRREAETAYADKAAFLESCRMELAVADATEADLPRVLELARRAHRLSSTQLDLDLTGPPAWLEREGGGVVVGRLTDRFGDYGLIALALTTRLDDALVVDLLAVSCRVSGRGVPGAFVAELLRRAGDLPLRVPIRATTANAELRLLVRSLGFAMDQTEPGLVVATLAVGAAPDVPHVRVSAGSASVQAGVDRLVAEALGLSADEVTALADATPMFGPPLELGSLSGTVLLNRILEQYAVDVAADDLDLTALTSLGHLRRYVAEATPRWSGSAQRGTS